MRKRRSNMWDKKTFKTKKEDKNKKREYLTIGKTKIDITDKNKDEVIAIKERYSKILKINN